MRAIGLALTLVGASLAVGPRLPLGSVGVPTLYTLFAAWVPGFTTVRVPVRLAIIAHLGLALLATAGAARLVGRRRPLVAWSAHEAWKFEAFAFSRRSEGPWLARAENLPLRFKDLQMSAPEPLPEYPDPVLHLRRVDGGGKVLADNLARVAEDCLLRGQDLRAAAANALPRLDGDGGSRRVRGGHGAGRKARAPCRPPRTRLRSTSPPSRS